MYDNTGHMTRRQTNFRNALEAIRRLGSDKERVMGLMFSELVAFMVDELLVPEQTDPTRFACLVKSLYLNNSTEEDAFGFRFPLPYDEWRILSFYEKVGRPYYDEKGVMQNASLA